MIGEMKREALHSLKGKWGLGVGSTILYHIVSYVVSMAVMLILLIRSYNSSFSIYFSWFN